MLTLTEVHQRLLLAAERHPVIAIVAVTVLAVFAATQVWSADTCWAATWRLR